MEIQSKHRKLTQLGETYKHLCQVVKSEVSFITDIPFMCSMDIASLFTNIPIDETIEICLNKLYKDKLLSVVSKLNKSNVIYKVNCNDCNEFYIGLTRRRLNVRLDEHSKRHYSPLYKHYSGTGHSINYQDPEIISTDNVKIRLQLKRHYKYKIILLTNL